MPPLSPASVQSWLDRYVAAWASGDRAAIGDLFTTDVIYRFRPFERPVVGRDAVVKAWLSNPDEPDSWSAEYRVWAVSGTRAAATGRTEYTDGSVFHNAFLLRFRGKRCCEYTEWFLEEPD